MPRSPTDRSSAPTKAGAGIILALAGIVLGVAGYLWWSSGRDKPQPHKPPKQSLAEEVKAKAQGAVAAGQPQAAIDLMQAYVTAHAADTEVRPQLARTLWTAGQAQAAEQVLSDLARLAPNLASAMWLRGEMAKSRGQADYMDWFAKAVASPSVAPTMLPAYALELASAGQAEEARKVLARADAAGAKDAAFFKATGLLAVRDEDHAGATMAFEQATKLDRADADAWRMFAAAQRRLNHLDKAAATLREGLSAARNSPLRTSLYLDLGRTLSAQSQPADAADAFAAAADPSILPKAERLEAALGAASAYHKLGRFALAMRYADLAIELDPSSEAARELTRKIEDARFVVAP